MNPDPDTIAIAPEPPCAFRFDGAKRTALDIVLGPSVALFAYGSLKDCGLLIEEGGLYALLDYAGTPDKTTSCVATKGQCLPGRVIHLTPDELARVDAYAERLGDYHRFLAFVVNARNNHMEQAWVYQLCSHAGPEEQRSSVCPSIFVTQE